MRFFWWRGVREVEEAYRRDVAAQIKASFKGIDTERSKFVDTQFLGRWNYWERKARNHFTGHLLLSLVGALAGLSVTGLTGLGEPDQMGFRITIFVLGLVAGLSAAANQTLKPDQRFVFRRRLVLSFQREGLSYLAGLGPYSELQPGTDESYKTFVDRVIGLEERAV